jgi:hypothetical protein
LYGSRDQIASRLAELRRKDVAVRGTVESAHSKELRGSSFDFELNLGDEDGAGSLQSSDPPELPERLTAGQAAQLSEVLEFVHIRLRHLLATVTVEGKGERVSLDARQWQYLLDLQSRIAEYLRDVTNPNRM